MQRELERTYLEIDLDALQNNLVKVRKLVGEGCRVMQVMKADAYGHGVKTCARYSASFVDWFAAATPEEAFAIREAAPRLDSCSPQAWNA